MPLPEVKKADLAFLYTTKEDTMKECLKPGKYEEVQQPVKQHIPGAGRLCV